MFPLISKSYAKIKQNSFLSSAKRDKEIVIKYINNFALTDTWVDNKNGGSVEFAVNVPILIDGKVTNILGGNRINNSQINIAGYNSKDPLLQRGDYIEIYYWQDTQNERGEYISYSDNKPKFAGFISYIYPNKPLRIEVEDINWVLKQAILENKNYATGDLQNIFEQIIATKSIQNLLSLYNVELRLAGIQQGIYANTAVVLNQLFFVSNITAFGNITLSTFLLQLKEQMGIECYFKRVFIEGKIVFNIFININLYPQIFSYNSKNGIPFIFKVNRQLHIKEDGFNLAYTRKQDIFFGVIMSYRIILSPAVKEQKDFNKNGQIITNEEYRKFLIYYKNGEIQLQDFAVNSATPAGINEVRTYTIAIGGDLRAYINDTAQTKAYTELTTDVYKDFTERVKRDGKERLDNFYYEGFRGSFKKILYPYLQVGDIIQLEDKILTETDGYYICRSCNTNFNGVQIEQEITLDRKFFKF